MLTKVGEQTFKILVDYYHPAMVTTKPYNDIIGVINKLYTKRHTVTTDLVTFAMQRRAKKEEVTLFINDVRALAGNCQFGSSLEERIRDQIIVGINDSAWQCEFLKTFASNKHTLTEVESLATRLERGRLEQIQLSEMTGKKVNSE